MNKEIFNSSAIVRFVKGSFCFFENAAENSFFFSKLPVFFSSSLNHVTLRQLGVVVLATLILKRKVLLSTYAAGFLDLKAFFYVLLFLAIIFLFSSVTLKSAFKGSSLKKIIGE